MNLYLKDPKTKELSVSLTMMMISFVAVLVAASLHMFKLVDDTSVLVQIFYGNVALYFGRRLNIGGKMYSSETSTNSDQGTTNGK